MLPRRLLVAVVAAATVSGLGRLLLRVLDPGGWTVAKILMLCGFAGAAPWVGLCLANGLIGWLLLVTRPRTAPGTTDIPPGILPGIPQDIPVGMPPTAIAITVRNEALGLVIPPALDLLDELEAVGAGGRVALFLLSDTTDPALARQEEAAVATLGDRIRYRRRPVNTGFKAGNVMDFLDHHAEGFELALILDADSRMTASAVLRLVRTLQDEPSLAIAQHLAVGLPAASAFPRLFQFGMRAGMRTWATALAWWQGDECVYWGHNAALRIAPFRTHARLPSLPDGSPILSHDQVEAALLRGAGWGVRLLPDEDGSAEANPPALPEFLRRELRWLAGNFQYRHLLAKPGLRPMGRWQLLQAILLFASTPFYLLFLLGAALAAATDGSSAFPETPAVALTLAWTGALYAPKLLGYTQVLLSPRQHVRYGGLPRMLAGMALETLFTLQLDAISATSKTIATIRLACGRRMHWLPQNRADRGVGWREAVRLLWPHTLLGCVVFAAFAAAGWRAVLWAAPFAGGLLTAVPFCVLTANPRLGAWLRHQRLAAVPGELRPSHRARLRPARPDVTPRLADRCLIPDSTGRNASRSRSGP